MLSFVYLFTFFLDFCELHDLKVRKVSLPDVPGIAGASVTDSFPSKDDDLLPPGQNTWAVQRCLKRKELYDY